MVHFGQFLKTWSLQSNSVTRQFNFNRTKIGGKCPNSKFKCDILSNFQTMWKSEDFGHFEWMKWSNKTERQSKADRKGRHRNIVTTYCGALILSLNWIPRRKMLKNAIMRLTRRIITHPINLLNWGPIFPVVSIVNFQLLELGWREGKARKSWWLFDTDSMTDRKSTWKMHFHCCLI